MKTRLWAGVKTGGAFLRAAPWIPPDRLPVSGCRSPVSGPEIRRAVSGSGCVPPDLPQVFRSPAGGRISRVVTVRPWISPAAGPAYHRARGRSGPAGYLARDVRRTVPHDRAGVSGSRARSGAVQQVRGPAAPRASSGGYAHKKRGPSRSSFSTLARAYRIPALYSCRIDRTPSRMIVAGSPYFSISCTRSAGIAYHFMAGVSGAFWRSGAFSLPACAF